MVLKLPYLHSIQHNKHFWSYLMPNHDPFRYERLLKILSDALTPEQFNQLKKWKLLHNAYEAYVKNTSIYSTGDERIKNNDVKEFLISEIQINNTISEIFLTLPDPDELRKRWDSGNAKEKAHTHEQAISELADFISQEYQILRAEILAEENSEYTRLEQINTYLAYPKPQKNITPLIQTAYEQPSVDSFLDDNIF